jgi:hypothetical protein
VLVATDGETLGLGRAIAEVVHSGVFNPLFKRPFLARDCDRRHMFDHGSMNTLSQLFRSEEEC